MLTSLHSAQRLPVFETVQFGEYVEGGVPNARPRGRPRRKKRLIDVDGVSYPSDFSADGPPVPPIQSAVSDDPSPAREMRILKQSYFKTMMYLCRRLPEAAGILLCRRDDESLITDFEPDETGCGTPGSFELDAPELNRVLKEKQAEGLTCAGIVHSHPAGITQPSFGDLHYFRKLFAVPANGNAQQLYIPIICSGRMYPYVFTQNEIHPAQLVLV